MMELTPNVFWQGAVTILVLRVLWKLGDYTLDRFLKKTVEEKYVTEDHCKECRGKQTSSTDSLQKELREAFDRMDENMARRFDRLRDALLVFVAGGKPEDMEKILKILKD